MPASPRSIPPIPGCAWPISPPARQKAFIEVTSSLGLAIPAISTSRRSVIDPEHGAEYLAYGEGRALDEVLARQELPPHGGTRDRRGDDHPAPLESGTINYHEAIRIALAHGFRSAFLLASYGGDGLDVCAANHRYLRRVLPRRPAVGAAP